MNHNAQINIDFPDPQDWACFCMTVLWVDAEGYDCRKTLLPADIPAGHLATFHQVVADMVQMGAPWRASQVAARWGDDGESVELTLYVQRDADGATRSFTSREIPTLRLADAAVLAAFRDITRTET